MNEDRLQGTLDGLWGEFMDDLDTIYGPPGSDVDTFATRAQVAVARLQQQMQQSGHVLFGAEEGVE
jgi:hypothetical protein